MVYVLQSLPIAFFIIPRLFARIVFLRRKSAPAANLTVRADIAPIFLSHPFGSLNINLWK